MDNAEIDKVGPIQRYYYEDMMCRRDNEVEKWHSAWKKTFVALIVAVCLILGGIIGFIYYEKQFEENGIKIIYFPYTKGVSSTIISKALRNVRGWARETEQSSEN